MKRWIGILAVFLVAGCGTAEPPPEGLIPPAGTGLLLPPAWTETLTPTTSPTPVRSATPAPSATFAPDDIPFGIFAQPASDTHPTAVQSIWDLTGFRELKAPGTETYSAEIDPDSTWRWDCNWCALKNLDFEKFLKPFAVEFLVDGWPLSPAFFRVWDSYSGGWYCRTWSTILSHWPREKTVNLEILITLSKPINDGVTDYQPGEYRQWIVVVVGSGR